MLQNLTTQWMQFCLCKKKNLFRKRKKTYKSSWSQRGNQSPFILTIHQNLVNPVKILSWNHCTSTPHRSETDGIAEKAVRRLETGTFAVLLQSGLVKKKVDKFHEMLLPSAKQSRSFFLIERHLVGGDSDGEPCYGFVIPFGEMIENTLCLLKTFRINSVQKFFQVYSFDIRCTGVESGKEPFWSQTLRNWNRWDASEIFVKRRNAKEVVTSMNNENFIFPVVDGTMKLSGRDQILKTTFLIRDRPDRKKEQGNLKKRIRSFFFTSLQNSLYMVENQDIIFVPFQVIFFTSITLNRESKCTSRKNHLSLFH